MLVGFGFKVAAVPFHQWAPDAYEGAPAPVTAWIATGSKLASFVALMKVFLHALLPWSNPSTSVLGPGWLGIVVIISAVTMTYGNFAALAQRNLKRMLAYSSIAHAGYILVGVAAASVSIAGSQAAGAVLYYLVVYAFANVGAFAVAAWLVRDKKTDDIDDLNGLGFQQPLLAVCILLLMLSLIGIPPLAGFFGKLYVFMEALDQANSAHPDHPDLAGRAGAVQLGDLGVLLRARAQGDVPARAGSQAASHRRAGRSRCRSCSVRWSGDRRDHGRMAAHADAGRRRLDAVEPDPVNSFQAPQLPDGQAIRGRNRFSTSIPHSTGPGRRVRPAREGAPALPPAATKKASRRPPPRRVRVLHRPTPRPRRRTRLRLPPPRRLRPNPKARRLPKVRQTAFEHAGADRTRSLRNHST